MVRSMTSFARRERRGEWGNLTLELRSVNHRYLETTVRLPDELRALEPVIRERIAAALSRGKVDCSVRYRPPEQPPGDPVVNRDLVVKLSHASREVESLLYNPAPVASFDLLRWPGVLEMPEPDTERLRQEFLGALDEVLGDIDETRAREGEKLLAVIEQRCDAMETVVADVRQHIPAIIGRFRERLGERLAQMVGELDEGRLEQEVVMLVQKMDVDEELDRLTTHLGEVRRVLGLDQPIGRRLDFLMQELNREANTLASKSADAGQTQSAVELKVLIEQIREQVQNIE